LIVSGGRTENLAIDILFMLLGFLLYAEPNDSFLKKKYRFLNRIL
jgi:hypothetical protein